MEIESILEGLEGGTLTLGEGDILVVKTNQRLSARVANEITTHLSGILAHNNFDNQVLVLCDGLELQKIQKIPTLHEDLAALIQGCICTCSIDNRCSRCQALDLLEDER